MQAIHHPMQAGCLRYTIPCAAVVVAAGASVRMGGKVRKPYLKLCGRPVLSWTLERLGRVRGLAQIVIVTRPEDRSQAQRAVRLARRAGRPPLPKRVSVAFADGGPRRQDSVLNGLRAANQDTEVVLIHDAARPFPPLEAMAAAVASAAREGAAILAVPVRDTVKRQVVGAGLPLVSETVPRAWLWLAQTPQVFRLNLIRDLLEKLNRATPDLEVTDDAAVCERFGHPVALIEGAATNLKITRVDDLRIAEALLRRGLV
jgi:2-C-methyl-D-erythritol 4-phosphate cytidylyltransferase